MLCEDISKSFHHETFRTATRCPAVFGVVAGRSSGVWQLYLLDPQGSYTTHTCGCVGGGDLERQVQAALIANDQLRQSTRISTDTLQPVALAVLRRYLKLRDSDEWVIEVSCFLLF